MCLPLAGEITDIGKCAKSIEQVQEELSRARQELAAVQIHAFFEQRPFVSSFSVSWEVKYDDDGMPMGEGPSCKVHFDSDFQYDAWLSLELRGANQGQSISIHSMESELTQIFTAANVRCPEVVLERDSSLMQAARLFMGERSSDWLARIQARALDACAYPAPESKGSQVRI